MAKDNFMTLMAAMMPVDIMIDILEKDINKYKQNRTKENLKNVNMHCYMLLQRELIDEMGGGIEGAQKLIDDYEKTEALNKLHKPSEQ